MTKFTWKALENLLEKQYNLTPDDAMAIILENLFSKDWKHGSDGKLGRMWSDPFICSKFNRVLDEEDKIAKTITRKKVQQELFKSDVFDAFIKTAGLTYKTYTTFKNDYAKWKRLPIFTASWKKGTITLDKLRKKLAAKNKILN